MYLTSEAEKELKSLMDEYENNLELLFEDCPGFCTNCGAVSDGVEPDASGYKCEECWEYNVCGLETLVISII